MGLSPPTPQPANTPGTELAGTHSPIPTSGRWSSPTCLLSDIIHSYSAPLLPCSGRLQIRSIRKAFSLPLKPPHPKAKLPWSLFSFPPLTKPCTQIGSLTMQLSGDITGGDVFVEEAHCWMGSGWTGRIWTVRSVWGAAKGVGMIRCALEMGNASTGLSRISPPLTHSFFFIH